MCKIWSEQLIQGGFTMEVYTFISNSHIRITD